MVLHGQLAVGLLDVLIRGVAVDAEDFVVVALLCHVSHSEQFVQRPIEGRVKFAPASISAS
jgi:hypothetical protein